MFPIFPIFRAAHKDHSHVTGPVTGHRPALVRQMSLWSAVGVLIGITIGSGIFRTPAQVAAYVPDPRWMLAVWLLGGIISLCGALSIAELAAALPRTGGLYVYLREGWGPLAGFLFGWSELVLIRASAVGAIATVFGEYFLRSVGLEEFGQGGADIVAVAAIVVAATANIRGVSWGAAIAGLSTVAKSGALLVIALAAWLAGSAHGAHPAHFVMEAGPVQPGLFGLALVSVLWAYDGFADVSYVSGEIRNPEHTLPRTLLLGTSAIVILYLLTIVAYLYVNPIDRISQSRLIAADTMQTLFGQPGATLVSIVVMVSTFGALNGIMLASPRIFFALANDGLFFRQVAAVHPRYHTPVVAILLAAGLGVAFVLVRTFEQLSDIFVLAIWPFYGLSVAAVYRLRRRRPDLVRPYRVLGYPLIPAVFILGVIYLVANALINNPVATASVLGAILAGVPVYYLCFPGAGRER